MNKEHIFNIMKHRMICREPTWNPVKPRIAVQVNDKQYEYDLLFCRPDKIYDDLNFLASIWWDLLPEKDMTVGQKQYEIAQYLVGKRNTLEFIELIQGLLLNSFE